MEQPHNPQLSLLPAKERFTIILWNKIKQPIQVWFDSLIRGYLFALQNGPNFITGEEVNLLRKEFKAANVSNSDQVLTNYLIIRQIKKYIEEEWEKINVAELDLQSEDLGIDYSRYFDDWELEYITRELEENDFSRFIGTYNILARKVAILHIADGFPIVNKSNQNNLGPNTGNTTESIPITWQDNVPVREENDQVSNVIPFQEHIINVDQQPGKLLDNSSNNMEAGLPNDAVARPDSISSKSDANDGRLVGSVDEDDDSTDGNTEVWGDASQHINISTDEENDKKDISSIHHKDNESNPVGRSITSRAVGSNKILWKGSYTDLFDKIAYLRDAAIEEKESVQLLKADDNAIKKFIFAAFEIAGEDLPVINDNNSIEKLNWRGTAKQLAHYFHQMLKLGGRSLFPEDAEMLSKVMVEFFKFKKNIEKDTLTSYLSGHKFEKLKNSIVLMNDESDNV